MSKRVLVACKIGSVLSEFLKARSYELVYREKLDRVSLLQEICEYDGIITGTAIRFDKHFLAACTNLKWIARMGSGMEQIDLPCAESKGVRCISSPDGNANAVAEQALGMYLALRHHIVRSFEELKQGIWQREANRGHEIEGQIAGIIGLGNNGHRFAEKLALLGLTVLAYDIEEKNTSHPAIRQVTDIRIIQKEASMISFHVPYNSSTHHYFDNVFLEQMEHPFTLLNLSRGKVVQQEAVLKGLQNGKITGAALDVWEVEPLADMPEEMQRTADALLRHDRFIGTPHIGGYTQDALYKMSASLKRQLEQII